MVVVPALSFIVSIIVAVSIPPSFGPIVMPPVPLTVNSVDGTVVDDSLDAATLNRFFPELSILATNSTKPMHKSLEMQQTKFPVEDSLSEIVAFYEHSGIIVNRWRLSLACIRFTVD